MYKKYRLKQDIIDQAKSANLVDYMLINHPDKVFTNYGVRDSEHDSLVLYPDSFCRFSSGEVQDNIYYLEHYQGYRWRDAVLELAAFAKENHDKPGTPAFDTGFRKKTERFFRPVETNHIELITDYLHNERGISIDTIQNLIEITKIYPATTSNLGKDFVCFANETMEFYSLRNISSDGLPKLQYTKNPGNFWWFSPLDFMGESGLLKFIKRTKNLYPSTMPLYICEAPIDAISLYELTHENAIYAAMGGLKPNVAFNIIQEFSTCKNGDSRNRRKIVIATDNDEPGNKFVESFPAPHERICSDLKDWNEDLFYLQ
ncbi:toprim domain-containing protein [[Clostridium] symbiosum]|uniref:toprim domain-containing protein n=1 Tax=Clostridium symbiosum TaxID=1512 RepID=UPI0018A11A14|nr:toprim domain-containing protein [[Clostridium] symbiosum]MDB2035253.1 toprim domain-containing protein [[Clostridium] symbiosum]